MLGKTLKQGGMELGCLGDRPTLRILFFWPSPSAHSPHSVTPPWREDTHLSSPLTGRPPVDICLKNPKDEGNNLWIVKVKKKKRCYFDIFQDSSTSS